MGETDPREEIVARAMCEAFGTDPDDTKYNGSPFWQEWLPEARAILAALDAARPAEPLPEISNWSTISDEPPATRWPIGTRVRKHSGTWWEGKVVGHYSTKKTQEGYNVQLDMVPNGPVQIYPRAALEEVCDD